MFKNKKKLIIVSVLVLIILIISLFFIFKINGFNFKTFKFDNSKKVTTTKRIDEETEFDDEEYLPSEEDVSESPQESTTTTSINTGNDNSTTKKSGKKTTTKRVVSGSIPKSSTAKFDSDINSVKLNPVKTRNPDLDTKVEKIINSVTNNKMTNNQKLYAVFRYIIDHSDYGNVVVSLNDENALKNKYHYTDMDGMIVLNSLYILNNKYGVCDNYASLLTVIARRIGFDAYFVGGSVKKASGGTTPHAWVNIKANGTWYNLDAQIADKRPKQEQYYYGKTDKEVNLYSCNRNSYINDFNKFKETSPLRLHVNLSGAVNDSKTVDSYSSNVVKDVNYSIYKGNTLNINIKASGASKYKYEVKMRNQDNFNYEYLYRNNNDSNTNINVSKTFNESKKSYYVYISVWSLDSDRIAEYYFYVSVNDDDRIKDLNVNIDKRPNGYNQPHNYTATFNATVSKVNPSSTCKPTFEYKYISSNDTSNSTGYYGIYSIDGGPRNNMDYIPGKTYNIKVIARCGSETLEKIFVVS